MKLLRAAALLLGSVFFADAAFACSWAQTIGDDAATRVVMIGRIAAHTSEPVGDRMAFGVVVAPSVEYRVGQEGVRDSYRVFPHGVGGDCSPHFLSFTSAMRYPIGALVTVIGHTGVENKPGDLSLAFGSGLDVLPEACAVRDVQIEYAQGSFEAPKCGSALFHAYKDVTLLASAPEEKRGEILRRLANSDTFTKFEELVAKYASETDAPALLDLQYKAVIERGCAERPADRLGLGDYLGRRYRDRTRWFEYCTSERQAAARNGD